MTVMRDLYLALGLCAIAGVGALIWLWRSLIRAMDAIDRELGRYLD